ncbi:hypothetical protein PENSPDRAFT_487331 [Peniophora sp. CONT]|nr:hypothetical protein PENSPDRAFT_487331 [Peniophora sp. CONT]
MLNTVQAAGRSANQSTYLLDLPSELLLYILSFLSARDLLAFRHICKEGNAISRDHAIWLEILRWQRDTLPLPPIARDNTSLVSLDTSTLEDLVVSAAKSSENWLKPRKRTLHLGGTPDEHSDILYLDVLLDQFVLCVHSNGSILVWRADNTTRDEAPASSWQLWADEPFTSAYACADEASKSVYVAVTRTQNPTHNGSTTSVVKVPLLFTSHSTTDPEEVTFFGAEGQIVRAIDPRRHLVAYSRISFIDLVHWPSMTAMSINTHTDDLEELVSAWNGIIGLSFVNDRLLCIRARSLELYPITFPFPERARYFAPSSPEAVEPTLAATTTPLRPVAVHSFFRTNFRTLSLSSSYTTVLDGAVPTSETTLFLLGNDILRGVYQYRIDILDVVAQSEEPDPPPDLRVSLLSMYTRIDGFVVAVSLGPQGRRGAVIERTRSSTARRVLAFTCPQTMVSQSDALTTEDVIADRQPGESDEDKVEEEDEDPVTVSMRNMRPLDAIDVYNVHSLDLRQDILHIAFSEVTGRIALGTRSGDVRLI